MTEPSFSQRRVDTGFIRSFINDVFLIASTNNGKRRNLKGFRWTISYYSCDDVVYPPILIYNDKGCDYAFYCLNADAKGISKCFIVVLCYSMTVSIYKNQAVTAVFLFLFFLFFLLVLDVLLAAGCCCCCCSTSCCSTFCSSTSGSTCSCSCSFRLTGLSDAALRTKQATKNPLVISCNGSERTTESANTRIPL